MSYSFSVIVPTKNRMNECLITVQSILNQRLLPSEVIIVDQSDSNEMEKRLQRLFTDRDIRLVYIHDRSIRGLTAAKNVGVREASGDIYCFLDDDMILYEDFLERLDDAFNCYSDIHGLSGVQVQQEKRSPFHVVLFEVFHRGPFADKRRRINVLHKWYEGRVVHSRVLSGGLTAYKADVFDDFKFDERLVGYCLGEDQDFSYRCSSRYKLAICTKAKGVHKRSKANRYSIRDRYQAKICSYGYFYTKNVEKNTRGKIAYSWLVIGLLMDAFIKSGTTFSLEPVRGLIQGFSKIKAGFKEIPFIDNSY